MFPPSISDFEVKKILNLPFFIIAYNLNVLNREKINTAFEKWIKGMKKVNNYLYFLYIDKFVLDNFGLSNFKIVFIKQIDKYIKWKKIFKKNIKMYCISNLVFKILGAVQKSIL